MMAVCLAWALNVAISKILLSGYHIPPLFYAGLRFLLVALILMPLLRPLPERLGRVLYVGILMGGAHFGLMFIGLQSATPSMTSIILQMAIPFSAVLSVCFLGEKMTPLRVAGIALALTGAIIMLYQADGHSAVLGLASVAGSAISLSVGSVALKRLGAIRPLQLQAWVAVVSALPLLILSALTESGQVTASLGGGWAFAAAVLFSIFVVTIWAHTSFFAVLQRYEVGVVMPLTLAMPLMTVALGVLLMDDPMNLRIATGIVLALVGVLLVQLSGSARASTAPPCRPDGR